MTTPTKKCYSRDEYRVYRNRFALAMGVLSGAMLIVIIVRCAISGFADGMSQSSSLITGLICNWAILYPAGISRVRKQICDDERQP